MAAPNKALTRAVLVAAGIPTVFVPGLILASILGWNWQQGLKGLEGEGGYRKSQSLFPTEAKVTQVLDGDTIEVNDNLTVRMLGIDSPDRGKAVWKEATEYLADLVDDEKVRLEYDTYQDDQYGRILAYVWEGCSRSLGCSNGERMINWVMVKKGYAKLALYADRRKLKYQDLLLGAQ